NTKKSDQISKIYDETIDGWSKAIEMRDKEMEGHSKRVVELTLELARKCDVHEKDLDDIRRGALLHDIGKIAIPDPILFKPGKLNEEEWQIMRKHPVYAFEFLAPITFLKKSIDIPYCHHEHWDGTGYPRGLKGEEIPLAARIFTIIDVWDALCSDRCYRSAWPLNEVQDYIVSQSGKLFDPRLTDIFIQLIEEKLIIEPNNDAQILEFS
ncbi:MAG: HD-GYP domain-containing protein, partial [Anaerolineaceae bacterium]|nr:HD-GYP domain-containing protein [Anaerolineaceae bacterium]